MAYIKKEPMIEFIRKGLNNPDKTKAYGYDAIEILAELKYAPTAEVEEVVRCKDCIYNEIGSCIHSENYDVDNYRADYFCADGERRKDDDV